MPLVAGAKLGPYVIEAAIGAGGWAPAGFPSRGQADPRRGIGVSPPWGWGYTNLKRSVAIKILPEALASDAEHLARFQREAEVLAILNHPNIAAIYGLERPMESG